MNSQPISTMAMVCLDSIIRFLFILFGFGVSNSLEQQMDIKSLAYMSPTELQKAVQYAKWKSLHDCLFIREQRQQSALHPPSSKGLNSDSNESWANKQFTVNSSRYGLIQKWPRGRIPYTLDDRFSVDARQRIFNAMVSIERSTCIRFVPASSMNLTASSGWVKILVNRNPSCKSHMGKIDGAANMVLLHVPACMTEGVIIHELMHTIGLLHEHTRNNRDQFVEVVWKNIKEDGKPNFMKDAGYAPHIPYDYESVLHYHDSAFSVNRLPTLRARAFMNFETGPLLRGITKKLRYGRGWVKLN
ncbi:unnamed protein product [Soboliphyme baturini]|uniref:Metalloendopeptidase n=1 Tax=Soboliphyme baturini TaxID=241478 RepID=A0A183IF56_9BILA|nr:unnamed protein product [Soboliphyme baturini]